MHSLPPSIQAHSEVLSAFKVHSCELSQIKSLIVSLGIVS